MRNKGKIHPFSSSSQPPNRDSLWVLKLLPTAIFALISVLHPGDREVLAYMITRSLESTTPPFIHSGDKRRSSKKRSSDSHSPKSPALFDCDCFHCYTGFWCRWDTSPNRELIHQAIEAFEEHLSNGMQLKRNGGTGSSRRREKLGGRRDEKVEVEDNGVVALVLGNDEGIEVVDSEEIVEVATETDQTPKATYSPVIDSTAAVAVAAVRCDKGLARKVLPDVIGIFKWRLWYLWSPNV